MHDDRIVSAYVGTVGNFDGSAAEKAELVRVVYSIMESFVDRAFGVDPVQQVVSNPLQALPEISIASGRSSFPRRNRVQRERARVSGRRTRGRSRAVQGGEAKCKRKAS